MQHLMHFSIAAVGAFSFCFLIGLVISYKPLPQAVTTIKYENCNNCKIEPKEDKDFIATLRSDPTATFTALLFVATVVLAAVTIGLYLEARNTGEKQVAFAEASARHADRSAKAAEAALTAAELSSEKQLRAYLGIVLGNVDYSIKDGFVFATATIRIKNVGQTPAHRVHCSIGVVNTNEFDKDAPGKSNLVPSTTYVFPEGSHRVSSHPRQMTDTQAETFVFGCVSYVDVFSTLRNTHFRFVARNMDANRSSELSPCDEGNYAT